MSNTYKHKKKGFINALEKQHDTYGWLCSTSVNLVNEEYKRKYGRIDWWDDIYGYNYYSRDPSWWRRLMQEKPARRETKMLCREITKANDPEWAEEVVFPLARKPHIYYW